MSSLTTKGIEITVETFFRPNLGQQPGEYLFAYRITLENHNSFTVQLMRRHWEIFDSIGEKRQVDGGGVIGKQPVLAPGETFQYMSGCNLKSEMGKMWGHYTMLNLDTMREFEVTIPGFVMVVPAKWN